MTDAPLRNKCFLEAVSEHRFHIRWRCGCPRALNRRGADGISVAFKDGRRQGPFDQVMPFDCDTASSDSRIGSIIYSSTASSFRRSCRFHRARRHLFQRVQALASSMRPLIPTEAFSHPRRRLGCHHGWSQTLACRAQGLEVVLVGKQQLCRGMVQSRCKPRSVPPLPLFYACHILCLYVCISYVYMCA